jgi:hypothetical protein
MFRRKQLIQVLVMDEMEKRLFENYKVIIPGILRHIEGGCVGNNSYNGRQQYKEQENIFSRYRYFGDFST